VGAVIGAIVCGRIANLAGRKKVILTASVLFIIGSIWSGMAPDANILITARLFLGMAIGVSSTAVTLYIAEISPAKILGMLVAMFQLLITVGIMVGRKRHQPRKYSGIYRGSSEPN
jgi:MFS family permease